MALLNPASSLQAGSASQSGTYKLDVSEVLAQILLADTDFLSMLGVSSETAKQTKHQWVEDTLNPTTVKQSGGNSALSGTTATVLVVSASQSSRITAGSLLRDQAASGIREVVQVTGMNGVSATVTRGYGSTTKSGHAASAVWEIIANARPQGMNGPKDESTARTFAFNYTQIFSKGVQITGTAEAIEHFGIAKEDMYQLTMRMKELKRELDRTLIMGVRAPNDVAATTYGTLAGVIDWTTRINTGNHTTTSEALTPTVLSALVKKAWNNGGYPDTILVGGVQKQKISLFDAEFRRSTMDTRGSGFTVETFVSDLGIELKVVVDRWVPNDYCLVLDSSRLKVLPLQGRSFFAQQLALTGDARNWQIVGEYTFEMRNADSAHAVHSKLSQ